jgi:hypothetical protein
MDTTAGASWKQSFGHRLEPRPGELAVVLATPGIMGNWAGFYHAIVPHGCT